MTTMRMPAQATGATKQDCGCGCGGTGGRCCGLECLVRPSFYCGQLLTDTDLSAVVQWTRDRLSLSRYRDGWGVVCGLEVTCSEPEGGCGCRTPRGSTVWISNGYAVDCCGNDLVVCEPIPVDLGCVCRPKDDPCADPCWPPVEEDPKARQRGNLPDIHLGDLHIPGAEQMIVDLYLRYGEQPVSGQRPLFRGACADVDACEPSRLLERPVPKLVPRPLASFSDDDEDESDDAERARLQKLLREQRARIAALFADADRDTLIRRLGKWRIYSVCLVMDYLRAHQELTEEVRDNIAGWLLLDWITHQFLCECRTCRTDEGVPLARLWLWRKDGRTECCRTLAIRNAAPFRRELQRDCRPITGSRIDLSNFFGKRAHDAMASMKNEGIRVEAKEAVSSREHLGDALFRARPEQALRMRTVKDWHGVERVIGFEHG